MKFLAIPEDYYVANDEKSSKPCVTHRHHENVADTSLLRGKQSNLNLATNYPRQQVSDAS